MALVARELGVEVAFDYSVFLAAYNSYVGTLLDLVGRRSLEGATDIAFRMEM